jgi:hypothetical protein
MFVSINHRIYFGRALAENRYKINEEIQIFITHPDFLCSCYTKNVTTTDIMAVEEWTIQLTLVRNCCGDKQTFIKNKVETQGRAAN